MGHVVVEGVPVPAAIASSFSDPKKRPFSYTEPLPPSAERPRTPHVPVPKVLPIIHQEEQQKNPSTEMPTNLQYNTPLPLYSREAAEEQYKQQLGAGPEGHIGSSDKHFDPEKSETLKAILASENSEFGKTFFDKIAQAEAPRISVMQEPLWTETARRRAERARSATPSSYATHQTPVSYYNPNYATIHGTSATTKKKTIPKNKGYEFGGLDFVDKSRLPQGPSYGYYQPKPEVRDERRATPGYEMGGTYFGKGSINFQGPYHGHGPEHPRLVPKYDVEHMKHNELNIETATNINNVSADILVGDTISNQKIAKDERSDRQRTPFGTAFGPTAGFKDDHRRAYRRAESPRVTTYSLSARKDYMGQGNLGYTPYQENRYRTQTRSYSAAPLERYETNDYGTDKEIYSYEPNWSRTVSERRNAWESQAQNVDAWLQRPASEKVPVHQPPHWYNKANQTHSTWQSAADRQLRTQSEYEDRVRYPPSQGNYGSSFTTESRYTSGYKSDAMSQPPVRQEERSKTTFQQDQTSQRAVPITKNTYSYQTVAAPMQSSTLQSYSGQLQKWEPKSAPVANQSYYSSSHFHKDEKSSNYTSSNYRKDESSREEYTSQPRTYTTSYETQRSSANQLVPASTKQTVTVTQGAGGDFNRVAEMAEVLPRGTIANTQASTQGNYTDADGRAVSYTRELVTSVDPNRECSLLKEEERRVVETPLEPGIISRHVTTKYYKKKTVTDTTTTTTTTAPQ